MAIDPVCHMTFTPSPSTLQSTHLGVKTYFCSLKCKKAFDANPESFSTSAHTTMTSSLQSGEGTDRDPICGMSVDKMSSLKSQKGARTYYFCSIGCLRTFEAPEAELKSMKTRVALAMSGILALALLRASAFLFLASGAMVMSIAPIPNLPWFTWGVWMFLLVTPVQFIGGWGFYLGAFDAIKNRAINMDLLIALGTSVAYFYSVIVIFIPDILPVKVAERDVYFEVSAVIIAFVLLGKYMEELIKKRSSAAIRNLMDLKPATAHVLRSGQTMDIPAETIQIDDVLLVKPGEKIPTDSVILEGTSSIDESMLTGESMPAEKSIGAAVIGGTINGQGLLTLKATRIGADTTLAQIIKLVEEAQSTTAPIQRLADAVTKVFVPAVIVTAFLSFGLWWAMGNFPQGLLAFIAVLIIACPCALGIATPAALMVGVGKGAQVGILIRGGDVLERAMKLSTVVFDKTGTLTLGKPSVTDILAVNGFNEDQLIGWVAALEAGSEHPLAQALVQEGKKRGRPFTKPEQFSAIAGHGIKGKVDGHTLVLGNRRLFIQENISTQILESTLMELEQSGKTAMLVGVDQQLAGLVAVADSLKPEAKEAIELLRHEGIRVIMLSGDNKRTAEFIARQIGITDVIAEVLPADKASHIQALKNQGDVVAMVGDGVNDAPALATADIGIAIGSGSDVAKETGHIILVKNDVRDVVTSIRLSKATMRKIKQNLFWAFFYNIIGVPIAAFGLLNPMIAAAAMSLSSLSVIVNSALLKRFKTHMSR